MASVKFANSASTRSFHPQALLQISFLWSNVFQMFGKIREKMTNLNVRRAVEQNLDHILLAKGAFQSSE